MLTPQETEILGIIAGTLTTGSFFPQAYKVFKSKHTKDLSLAMYSIITLGIVIWIFYGLLVNSISIIIANGATFLLAFYILLMKLRYK